MRKPVLPASAVARSDRVVAVRLKEPTEGLQSHPSAEGAPHPGGLGHQLAVRQEVEGSSAATTAAPTAEVKLLHANEQEAVLELRCRCGWVHRVRLKSRA
jgi:hypothetical protein